MIEDKQAVGIFWAPSKNDLMLQVDDVCNVDLCEYMEIHGSAAIVWEGKAGLMGVPCATDDIDDIDHPDQIDNRAPLMDGATLLYALEPMIYGRYGVGDVVWRPFFTEIERKRIREARERARISIEARGRTSTALVTLGLSGFVDHGSVRRVYFIGQGTYIKIGHTHGPAARRMSALASGSPEPLMLLAEIPYAKPELEYHIHEMFGAHRVRGEWFRAAPELLSFIDTIKSDGVRPQPR